MKSSSIQPSTPLNLSGDLAANWKHFHQVWTNYAIITGLEKQTGEYKVTLFLHYIGSEALKAFSGFSFDDEGEGYMHIVGWINETFDRYRFNSTNQEPSEGIDAHISALGNLAKTCNFGSLHDSVIRDRIAFGVQSKHTRQKLLQECKLTLEKCMDICSSNEATSSQIKEIASGSNLEMKLININNSNFITASPTTPSQPEINQLMSTEKIVQEYADIFEREVGTLLRTIHFENEDNTRPVIIPKN